MCLVGWWYYFTALWPLCACRCSPMMMMRVMNHQQMIDPDISDTNYLWHLHFIHYSSQTLLHVISLTWYFTTLIFACYHSSFVYKLSVWVCSSLTFIMDTCGAGELLCDHLAFVDTIHTKYETYMHKWLTCSFSVDDIQTKYKAEQQHVLDHFEMMVCKYGDHQTWLNGYHREEMDLVHIYYTWYITLKTVQILN